MPLVLVHMQHIAPQHFDAARDRLVEPDDGAQHHRLARARPTDHPHHLAAPHIPEVDAVMNDLRAERVHQVADADDDIVVAGVCHRHTFSTENTDRERCVRDDYKKIDSTTGLRRQSSDAFGAACHVEPLVAADKRDDRGEKRCLYHPDPERRLAHRRLQLTEEIGDVDVEHYPGHQPAAKQPHEVGIEHQQRQRQREPEQPRQHQRLDPGRDRACAARRSPH